MAKRRTKKTKPAPLRAWYIALAVFCLIGGLGNVGTNADAAVFGLIAAAVMLFFTFRAKKKQHTNNLTIE